MPSRGKYLLACACLVVLGGLFLTLPRRPPAAKPLREVHRKDLELRPEGWCTPGETTAFTGVLMDTYEGGQLRSRSAVLNGLLDGLSEGWHTNGQRQVEEHFVAGTSHGLRTKWHPNGQKQSEVEVVHGQLQGTFRSWHDSGQAAEELELRDGKTDGRCKAYFSSGFLKSLVTFEDGRLVEQKYFKDGEFRESTSPLPNQRP